MKTIVLKIGGSFLFPDMLDKVYIKKIKNLITELSKNYRFAIVVGGGRPSRNYIETARKLALKEDALDLIGIDVTRANARIVAAYLGDIAYQKPCKNLAEVKKAWSTNKIPVLGGLQPKQSTDAVAAEVAEFLKADKLIITTDVDYIYENDPDIVKNAKKYEKININELQRIIRKTKSRAGHYSVVDERATAIIKRAKLKTFVLNGRNLDNVEKAIKSDDFVGTKVV